MEQPADKDLPKPAEPEQVLPPVPEKAPAGELDPAPASAQAQPQIQVQAVTGGLAKKLPVTKVLLALCLSLVVILNAMAFLWWKDHSAGSQVKIVTKTVTVQPQKETISCDSSLSTFQNTELHMGFCYPSGWGAATLADYKNKPDDIGNRWKITFVNQPAAKVTLVTDNWSSSVSQASACADPVKTMPSFMGATSAWKDNAHTVETQPDKYFVREYTGVGIVSGVCLEGLVYLNQGLYTIANVSYAAQFDSSVRTPTQHTASPNKLISESDRAALRAVMLSLKRID